MPQVDWVSVNGPRYWPQLLSRGTSPGMDTCAAPRVALGAPSRPPTDPHVTPMPMAHGVTTPWPSRPGSALPAHTPVTCQILPVPGAGSGVGQGQAQAQAQASSLEHLYAQQLVFVKKKAGSLSYADDPSGIRSLLSRAFHTQQATVCSWLGQGDDASLTGAGRQGGGEVPGSDIVHLCATFSADPFIMAFAQHVQHLASLSSAAQQHRAARSPRLLVGRRLPSSQLRDAAATGDAGNCADKAQSASTLQAVSGMLQFCTAALYECISGEKTGALDAYLLLFSLVHCYCPSKEATQASACAPFPGVPMWLAGTGITTTALRSIPLVRASATSPVAAVCAAYAASLPSPPCASQHAGTEQGGSHQLWAPLVQPVLVEGLWARIKAAWYAQGYLPPVMTPLSAPGTSLPRAVVYYSSALAQAPQTDTDEDEAGASDGNDSSTSGLCHDGLATCLALIDAPLQRHFMSLVAAVRHRMQQQGYTHGASSNKDVCGLVMSTAVELYGCLPHDALQLVASAAMCAILPAN